MATFKGGNPVKLVRRLVLDGGFNTETLGATRVLLDRDAHVQKLDPGGSAREVDLRKATKGDWFLIVNAADASENLTIKQPDSSTTLATVNQNEAALVFVEDTGLTWTLGFVFTIALS